MRVEIDVTITLDIPEGEKVEDHSRRVMDAIHALAMSEERCVGWSAGWEPSEEATL